MIRNVLIAHYYRLSAKDSLYKYKRCAFAILAAGFVFLLPLGIIISGIAIISELQGVEERQAEMRRIQAFEAIENKIYVKMNDDFYHTTGVLQNLEKVGALVIEDSNEYYRFYQLEICDARRVKVQE